MQKIKLRVWASALLGAYALTGCGDASESEPSSSQVDAVAPVKSIPHTNQDTGEGRKPVTASELKSAVVPISTSEPSASSPSEKVDSHNKSGGDVPLSESSSVEKQKNPPWMDELEQSMAGIDDATLLARYQPKGSAIPVAGHPVALAMQVSAPPVDPNEIAQEVPVSAGAASVEPAEQTHLGSSSGKALVSHRVGLIGGAHSIDAEPSGFGFSINLSGDYLFEFDRYNLTEKAVVSLEKVLALYQEYEGQEVTIIGHTDAKGDDAYNQKLSEKRAVAVRDWFVAHGVASGQVITQGMGETKPVAPNMIDGHDNPKGRALNRRVHIAVKTAKKVTHLPLVGKDPLSIQ